MTDPLAALLMQAWASLAGDGRTAPLATLATISEDGWPQARSVLIRRADRAAAQIDIRTDAQSAKLADLRAAPRATLLLWDRPRALQIRIAATVTILTGAPTSALWAAISAAARADYGPAPPPGTPIPGPLDYTPTPDPARLAILRLTALRLDLLMLGPPHRRAAFGAPDGWAGHWVAP